MRGNVKGPAAAGSLAGALTIRGFSLADVDAVLALEQAVREAPHWSRGEYELMAAAQAPAAEAMSGRTALVAEVDGRIGGFVVVRHVRLSEGESVCELESIVVGAEYRRRGVGWHLLSSALEVARRESNGRVEVEVRESNAAAIRLYARAGLVVEGRRRNYYSDPDEDALLMGRDLRGL